MKRKAHKQDPVAKALADAHRLIVASEIPAALTLLEPLVAVQTNNSRVFSLLSMALYKASRLADAIRCGERAALLSPEDPDILNNLAVYYKFSGQAEQRLQTLLRAVALAPKPIMLANLADAYITLGQHELGIEQANRAILADPKYDAGYLNLAVAYQGIGRIPEAREAVDTAMRLNDKRAESYNTAGCIYSDLALMRQARNLYEKALTLNPAFEEALNNLGILALNTSDFALAEDCLRKGLNLNSERAETWGLAAIYYLERFELVAAEAASHRALALNPGRHISRIHLCNVLFEMSRANDLVRQLALLPELGKLNYKEAKALGDHCAKIKQHEGALQAYERAVQINPHNFNTLTGLIDQKLFLCQWNHLYDQIQTLYALMDADNVGGSPFTLAGFPGITPERLKQTAQYVLQSERDYPPCNIDVSATPKDRLRVGYLSADFREHPVGYHVVQVLEAHDPKHVELFCYCLAKDEPSPIRQRVKDRADHFTHVRAWSSEKIAATIAADRIDILVDLTGFMTDGRSDVLLYHPAPVQAQWIGYPGTFGKQGIAHYIIADPVIAPVSHEKFYGEYIAQMPHCYLTVDIQRPVVRTATRATQQLPKDAFVFCSFNRPYKYHPELLDLWVHIVKSVPGSVLWMGVMPAVAAENVRRECRQRGLEDHRVLFAPKMADMAEHLGRIALADLALDPFPFTGHTTTSDALIAGLPVLAWEGETFAGRVSSSIMQTAGFPELVAKGADDYASKAIALANAPATLADIRRRIAESKADCPLYNDQLFARDLENLYANMWANHCRGHHTHIETTAPKESRP